MSQNLIPFEKEAVKAYLDRNIVFWRERLDAGNVVADDYIDAYQSVRMTLFGELLPLEGGITMRAPDVANVTAISVSCPRCGLTWSEFPEDFCVCDPNTTPYAVGINKCYRCGKPRG